MASPKTKEEALRQMRLMWFAFLMTIPRYIYGVAIGGFAWLNVRRTAIFDGLGILDLLSFAWIRIRRFAPALRTTQEHSEDISVVRHWLAVSTALLTIAEAEAVFGTLLQIGHNALKPAAPFYALASLLLLTLWPRRIWSSEATATRY